MNNYKKLLKVDFTTLVGKSLERAKKTARKQGFTLRINSIDGVQNLQTPIRVNNRINVDVVDNTITSYNGIG